MRLKTSSAQGYPEGGPTLKTKTLGQPHATLIAIGEQRIFTTEKPAPKSLVGQRFAIHAAAKPPGPHRPGVVWAGGGWACWYAYVFGHWTLQPTPECSGGVAPLPLGCIVATAVLADCVPILDHTPAGPRGNGWVRSDRQGLLLIDTVLNRGESSDATDQLPYCDFTPGRWAWLLDSVEPVTETCPGCGGKGTVLNPYTDWRCGCGPGVRHVADCGRPAPKEVQCPTCFGFGRCDPIPAKGRQGLWEWTP